MTICQENVKLKWHFFFYGLTPLKNLLSIQDPVLQTALGAPSVQRAYWRAVQDALQCHGIVDVQGADLRFGDRGRQLVVGHDRSSFRLRHAG